MKDRKIVLVALLILVAIFIIGTLGTPPSGKSVQNPKTQCEDSDGYFNIFEKGTTTSGSEIKQDYCNSKSQVVEHTCKFGCEIASLKVDCPENYFCNEGACIKK